MRRPRSLLPLAVAILLASPTLALAGCGLYSGGADVDVALNEYSINVSRTEAEAEFLRFHIKNEGRQAHEFVILRKPRGEGGAAESAAEKPEGPGGESVAEAAPYTEVVNQVRFIQPGESRELSVEVQPGTYRLACLLVSVAAGENVDHFAEGMHLDFEVK